MSSHAGGVQTRTRAIITRAQYVHWRPHVLNLCIVHSSKVRIVRNVIDTMTELSMAFKTYAKRFPWFQEQLGYNAPVREEMGKRFKLKTLYETR